MIGLYEGEINEMHIGFKGTHNAMQLKQIAHGVRRGQKGRVKAGRIPGGISYGYKAVKKFDGNGDPIRGLRTIDEEKAAVIRRIFKEYLLGKSPRAIAAALNKEGIPSPRNGEWMASTISGNPARQNGILCNMLYTGKIAYNRQRFIKDPETGKRQARMNPPEEWVIQDVEDLKIIDDDTWNKAQSMKRAIAGKPKAQQARNKHLLSGLVKCGECGGSYTVYGNGRYACSHRRERGTCTNSSTILIKELEERILAALTSHMVTPELLKDFEQGYNEAMKDARRHKNRLLITAEKNLATTTKKIDGFMKAMMDGLYTPTMKEAMEKLEIDKTNLEKEIAALDVDNVIMIKPNMASMYKQQIERLINCLKHGGDNMLDASAQIRSLVGQIIIVPSKPRQKPEVELKGDLAAILNFIHGEEVLMPMVAGVGFNHDQHWAIIAVAA
jgi:hypothetical protein